MCLTFSIQVLDVAGRNLWSSLFFLNYIKTLTNFRPKKPSQKTIFYSSSCISNNSQPCWWACMITSDNKQPNTRRRGGTSTENEVFGPVFELFTQICWWVMLSAAYLRFTPCVNGSEWSLDCDIKKPFIVN